MHERLRTTLAAALMILSGSGAIAEDDHATSAGALRIVHAWTRASDAGTDSLVFMEIENEGDEDRLTGAVSANASGVTIVGLTIVGGEVSTAPVGPIVVPRGALELDPGGLALELRDLREPLAVGGKLELTLMFERAGKVVLHVDVEAADASRHSHDGHRH